MIQAGPTRRAALLLASIVAACGTAPGRLEVREVAGPEALNGAFVVSFDGELEPLGATSRAVRLRDEHGRELEVECAVSGRELRVSIVVGPALLQATPAHVTLELAGLPSPHALASRDGRRLPAPVRRTAPLPAVLRHGSAPVRLVRVDGHAPDGAPKPLSGEVRLLFDGVLDPATLRPAAIPLQPVLDDGVALSPVDTAVQWSIVGGRTELRLAPPQGCPRVRLHTRSLGLRGLRGEPIEPLLVLEWERG